MCVCCWLVCYARSGGDGQRERLVDPGLRECASVAGGGIAQPGSDARSLSWSSLFVSLSLTTLGRSRSLTKVINAQVVLVVECWWTGWSVSQSSNDGRLLAFVTYHGMASKKSVDEEELGIMAMMTVS